MVIDIRANEDPLRVLVVGRGNVCRSPAAERLLAGHAAAAGIAHVLVVRSAGTRAPLGAPLDPATESALRALVAGGRGSVVPISDTARRPHRARQVTDRRIATADLVLTTSRAERRQVAAMRPEIVPVLFTLSEFARLAERADVRPPCSPADLVRRLHGERAVHRSVPSLDDIAPLTTDDPAASVAILAVLDRAAESTVGALRRCLPRVSGPGRPQAEETAAATGSSASGGG